MRRSGGISKNLLIKRLKSKVYVSFRICLYFIFMPTDYKQWSKDQRTWAKFEFAKLLCREENIGNIYLIVLSRWSGSDPFFYFLPIQFYIQWDLPSVLREVHRQTIKQCYPLFMQASQPKVSIRLKLISKSFTLKFQVLTCVQFPLRKQSINQMCYCSWLYGN